MKNVLKIGVLAIALGMFVAACNSGTTGNNSADSVNTEMAAPSNDQIAPPDTTPTSDTSGADSSNL